MGYSSDLGTSYVKSVDKLTGYPVDEYGHLLNPKNPRTEEMHPEWDKPGTELFNLTSPYGFLHFAIGTGDDFVCLDYRSITGKDGIDYMVLHATVNSETGSFIDRFEYVVTERSNAPAIAMEITLNALEWAHTDDGKHNKSGWNQDPYYFYRCVYLSVNPPAKDFSEREKRYGGKRINRYCGLNLDELLTGRFFIPSLVDKLVP